MDTIISRRLASDRLYAYHRNRFWLWDDTRHSWKESHLMSQKFEREHDARPTLTPADFMTDLTKFQQLDEFEIDSAMLDALKDTKPCKAAPIKPVEELPPQSAQCSDAATAAEKQTAAFPAVPEVSSPTTEMAPAAQNAAVPASASEKSVARSAGSESSSDKTLNFLPENTIPEFDYSGLPEQAVENLHFAEDEYRHGKQMAERGLVHMGNAVAAAHDELVAQCDKHSNQHSEDSFRAWCLSIGITKDSAYRLLQVSALMAGSSPRQRAILESLPPTLLYAVAKPSAPQELVEKVKNGEVPTNKAYQDLLKENQQLRTDRVNAMNQAEREKQRADAAEAREEEAWKLQSKSEAKAKDAETELEAVTADLNGLYDRAAQAEARNTALLDERAEYVQRIKELESRPIEVMHDPEETDRLAHQYAYGIAADMTEELRTKNNQQPQTIAALQKELEAARSTNGYDPQSDLETVCACIGSMEQMWGTALPAYERLSGKDLRTATDTLQDVIGRLYGDMARTAEDGEN
nr:MAG TPA: Protein of unknown function (DUF3102) [Caudoviricetes sp.]